MTNRITSCPFPTNINPLHANGYKFAITKLPDVTYFCQEVTLPQIMLGDIMQATPLTMIALPGDQITYDLLTMDFLVDSTMSNYVAIHNWMVGLGFPESNSQFTDYISGVEGFSSTSDSGKEYSDAILQILDGSNNPVRSIQFIDLVPQALEGLTFTSTSQDVQYLVGRASFRYTYYKFI